MGSEKQWGVQRKVKAILDMWDGVKTAVRLEIEDDNGLM